MGFIATFLRLPKAHRRQTSYFRKTEIEPTIREKRILENFHQRQEQIQNTVENKNKNNT